MNLTEIIQQYQTFASYLDQIDVEALKETHTRNELKELKTVLSAISIRSIPYALSEVIDQMKKEEYPQLLDVHHYPELKKATFLSEEKQIKLDQYLGGFYRLGEKVSHARLYEIDNNPEKQLIPFLVEQNIIEPVYYVNCPYHNEIVSTMLSESQINEWRQSLEKKDEDLILNWIDQGIVSSYCDAENAEHEIEWFDFNPKNLAVKTYYQLIKEKDTSLDNV